VAAFPTKMAFMTGLILLAIVFLATYTNYTETKAWIFGSDLYVTYPEYVIPITQEELTKYPTVKAYIDYIDSNPGILPLKSMSIDPFEARLLVFFLSQRASYDMKPETGSSMGECARVTCMHIFNNSTNIIEESRCLA
jgi:hypothetical protein